jgi:peptide/nickel transport system substrate-binding protein
LSSYWDNILAGRISRRRALAATAATSAAAALLAACGGDGGGGGGFKFDTSASYLEPGKVWNTTEDWRIADETSQAVKGGIFRGSMNADQAGNYDALAQAPSQVPFSDHVHEFLMSRNEGPGIDPASAEASIPKPNLAEAFEVSADGMTVTFTLRSGVKWHNVPPVNGRVMDIDDWKTSMEHFLALSPQRVPMEDVLSKAEYPDARHMVWKLKYPYAPIYYVVTDERFTPMFMPKELNTNLDLARSVAIGTGFKILDKNQPSITMEYRKNADYWGGEPFIDRWHYPIIPEYSNRYAQFVNGNIVNFTPNARDVLIMAKDAPKTVIVQGIINPEEISRIRFGRNNNKTLPWKDPRVRIALRRSMDMLGIGEFLANKQQFEAAGIPITVVPRTHLPHGIQYWLDPEKGELGKISDNYLYNVAEAKKLMEAAGFSGPVDIDYWVLPAAGVVPEQDSLVEDSLKRSGLFNVKEIQSANTVAHRECRSLGRCDGLVQSSSSRDPDGVIYRDYHSQGNTEGEQAYPDPRIDAIAEAQRKELDPQKRIQLLKDFQMLAGELMPAIPYIHDFTTYSFRWPWVHNINHGSVNSGRPTAGGHLQWLDKDMPNRERGAL